MCNEININLSIQALYKSRTKHPFDSESSHRGFATSPLNLLHYLHNVFVRKNMILATLTVIESKTQQNRVNH